MFSKQRQLSPIQFVMPILNIHGHFHMCMLSHFFLCQDVIGGNCKMCPWKLLNKF